MVYKNTGIRFSYKNTKSIFYYVVLGIILLGFFFFFNSKSIMPDTSPIFNTPIGKIVEIGSSSTKIYISSWIYNPKKHFMEVQIKYYEPSDSLSSKFKFAAKPKSNVISKLPVKILLETDDTYVVNIQNVPTNFEAISLKVSQDDSDISLYNDDFESTNKNSNNYAALYCDYRKVKTNKDLKIKTPKYYLMQVTKNSIEEYKNKIKIDSVAINKNKKLIDAINKKINDLNEQYKYEIEEDQRNTTNKINELNSRIKEINQKNDNLVSEQNENKEKIQKLQIKENDIKKQ